jgi:hypothetical protein
MADDKTLATVLRLLLKHDNLVDTLAIATVDHALLLEKTLERCGNDACDRAATVRHLTFDIKRCDHHAARFIVGATLGFEDVLDDGFHPLQRALANESMWIDIPDALQIRRLQDIIAVVRQDNEPEPPADKQLLH